MSKILNENLEKKTIGQIVAFAGEDGKLTDGSLAQQEIREFFSLIETDKIIEGVLSFNVTTLLL